MEWDGSWCGGGAGACAAGDADSDSDSSSGEGRSRGGMDGGMTEEGRGEEETQESSPLLASRD